MSSAPVPLEPVTPDPKRLRRTAWILVAIMVLGGTLVMKAYEKWSQSKAGDTRPATVYRINKEKDLRLMRQDGRISDLWDLYGKVLVVNATTLAEPLDSLENQVLQRLAREHADTQDLVIVSLLLDPLREEELAATLARTAEARGWELPQRWLGSTTSKILHRFVKNELKTGLFPQQLEDGAWRYDRSLVLIDRDRHIRRAVVPQARGGPPYVSGFDFEQAASWDARGVKTGTERNNVEELERLLHETIATLLAEPVPEP